MSGARLPLSAIRTLADDAGVTFDYGPGTARLYGPPVADAAEFTARLRDMPEDIARAGGRRIHDGPPLTTRAVPRPPNPGKPRRVTLAELARYSVPDRHDPGKCADQRGRVLAGYRVVDTDGHAMVLTADGVDLAADACRVQAGPELPARWTCTPAFWCAYGRVRTCRPERSDAIRFCVDVDGVTIRAEEPEGWSARELVPDAGTSPIPYDVVFADAYLWPLRGTRAVIHQENGLSPIWVAGLDPIAVVIMPMRI